MKIFAFDTETRLGKAFLLTYSIENKDLFLEIKCTEDVKKIFNKFLNSGTGFAYNLEYDTFALLKWILDDTKLPQLYFLNKFEWEDYEITVIPRKLLEIRYKGKLCQIFDIYQFYATSLDRAGEKHLGEKKIQIGEENRKNYYEFFLNNRETAIQYALKDSNLTFRLAKLFLERLSVAGINVSKYYSSGYIAMKHLTKHYAIRKFSINNPKVNEFVKEAYFGGRIEFFKRGFIENSHCYDVNSAYPSVIKELKTIEDYEFTHKIDNKSTYFFARISCNLRADVISPLAYRTNTGMVIYPQGKINSVVVDNYTFKNIKKYATDIVVHECLNIYSYSDEKPFDTVIDDLYKQRKLNEGNNYIFKLILNSLYGKMAENKKEFVKIEAPESNYDDLKTMFKLRVKEECPKCYKLGFVSDKCRNDICKEYRKRQKEVITERCYFFENKWFKFEKTLGKKANIIYAALITAKIRNLLFETAEKIGFEHIHGFMTDAIFTDKKMPKNLISKKLGKFDTKKEDKPLYVIGTGIYQHADESKHRGFRTHFSLIELAKTNKNKNTLTIDTTSRVGVGQLLQRNLDIDELNIITDDKKEINLNFDKKRIWEKKFSNFGQSIKQSINSKTVTL